MKLLLYIASISVIAMLSSILLVIYVHGDKGPEASHVKITESTQNLYFKSGNISYQFINEHINKVPFLFLHGFNGHLGSWQKSWQVLSAWLAAKHPSRFQATLQMAPSA